MKIRFDFVTNSSSSSFILGFDSKENGMFKIEELKHIYGSDYIDQLLEDFEHENPIPREQIEERFKHDIRSAADLEISWGDGNWWNSDKDTFENRWKREHPDASPFAFYDSEEYKTEMKRISDKLMEEFLKDVEPFQYIVEIEYEDHTDVGSALEHNILPNCDFTIRRFSHH